MDIEDGENKPLMPRSGQSLRRLSIIVRSSSKSLAAGATLSAVRKWWSVSKLWFSSEERIRARAYASATVALSITTTILLLKISSVQAAFNSALSEKQPDDFHTAVLGFVVVIIIAAPLFALNVYVDARLAVEWRSWMARRLINAYLGDKAYFRLKMDPTAVDNPDQRITEDVRSFTSSSVSLAVGVCRQIFYCVAFSGLLFSLMPNLVFFLLAYAGLGTVVTAAGFGRRLATLAFSVLQREADLRFDLVRVRENAESVAFYGADVREAATASSRLDTAVAVTRQQVALEAYLALWQNVYSYATVLVPSLIMAPKYFSGEVRFGTIAQVSFAFNRIEAALSFIVNNLADMSSLAAQTERLDALITALQAPAEKTPGSSIRRLQDLSSGLRIDALELRTPGGARTLCRGLSLALSPGDRLLIVGPSGSGKSSIMRAIAGLWDAGAGAIHTPPADSLFFLPQKPYMPLGTLRQQLYFPDDPGSPNGQTDGELLALLRTSCLPDLAARVGGLDAESDWAYILSLGEQQRVAFLRLLRRRPAVAFLDESTSGVDAATEAKLYEALKAACQCFVSVGHRKELLAHHTHVLQSQGEGEWVLHTAAEYAAMNHS